MIVERHDPVDLFACTSANRLKQKIDRLGRRLRSNTRDAHQETYGKLLKVARTNLKQAEQLVELLGDSA